MLRKHHSLQSVQHRPWPLSEGAWWWRQSWNDLLFIHYTVPSSLLKPLVPEPLKLQEIDGQSWIGIVPFKMEGVMLRPFPDVPGLSAFLELNVRLYVQYNEKPGVWFLSLDANHPLIVWLAKKIFYLPYKKAEILFDHTQDIATFTSRRLEMNDHSEFKVKYTKEDEVYFAKPGSLEHFLTERYCLYCQSPNGMLYRVEVHHEPWPLQKARGEINKNTLLDQYGIPIEGSEPFFMYSKGVDVVAWNLVAL